MLKSDNKKPSKQFINYLKDTPMLPLTKTTMKQKAPKVQSLNTYNGPRQGDFSKISTIYIVKNDKLAKKDYDYLNLKGSQIHNQNFQENSDVPPIQIVKEIAKLEYLEKKGYLKPEQMEKLQKLRGKKQQKQITNQKSHKKIINPKNYQSMQFVDCQNINPNIYRPHDNIQGKSMKFNSMNYSENYGDNNFDQNQYFQQPYYQKSHQNGQIINFEGTHIMNHGNYGHHGNHGDYKNHENHGVNYESNINGNTYVKNSYPENHSFF